jgi:hypothetical protein
LIELFGYPSRVEEDAAEYKAVSLAVVGSKCDVLASDYRYAKVRITPRGNRTVKTNSQLGTLFFPGLRN